jgi:UDP-N-acetylglucosamine 2-epimerase
VPSREAFFASVDLVPKAINLAVTFHPETLAEATVEHLDELLAALDQLGPDVAVLFTGSNADPEARQIEARIEAFVAARPSRRLVGSLGAERYFAALTYMEAVVGNSSSGLYEAPSFGIPTVNIGDRQTGRLKAASVIDCRSDRSSILVAIRAALARGRKSTINPYGDGFAAPRIIDELARRREVNTLLVKRFVDLEVG